MDRAAFNSCMRPYMGGKGKSKEERRMNMCIGAKLCTGKAKTEEEALKICNKPKLPKWAKEGKKEEEENLTCPQRDERLRATITETKDTMKSGQTDDLKPLLARSLKDIHTCHADDDDIVKLADDTFSNVKEVTKGYFFKGEAREVYNDLDLLLKTLEA